MVKILMFICTLLLHSVMVMGDEPEVVVENYEWAETPRLVKLSSNFSSTGASCGKEFELCIGQANRKAGIEAGLAQQMIKCFIPKNRFECPREITASNQCVPFDAEELTDAGRIPACVSGGGTDNRHFKCRCETRYIPASEKFYAQRFAECTQENNRRRAASLARQQEIAQLQERQRVCQNSSPAGTWQNNQCRCPEGTSLRSYGSCETNSDDTEDENLSPDYSVTIYQNVVERVCTVVNSCGVDSTESADSRE